MTDIVGQMTDPAAQGSMTRMHKLARMLGDKNSNGEANLYLTASNDIIVSERARLDVWADFLDEKKFKAPTLPLLLPEQLSTLPANCGITMSTSPVTQDEVDETVFHLANGKAVGADGIMEITLRHRLLPEQGSLKSSMSSGAQRRYQRTGLWADLSCCTRKAAETTPTTTGQYACSPMPTRSYPAYCSVA